MGAHLLDEACNGGNELLLVGQVLEGGNLLVAHELSVHGSATDVGGLGCGALLLGQLHLQLVLKVQVCLHAGSDAVLPHKQPRVVALSEGSSWIRANAQLSSAIHTSLQGVSPPHKCAHQQVSPPE